MKTIHIRQSVNVLLAFCLLGCGIQFLTGCAKDAHMDEYIPTNSQPGTSPVPPLSDEVSKKLETIPGVSDVYIQLANDGKEKGYYFSVEQQVDHFNASDERTFKQRCFLDFESFTAPVVLGTQGYALTDSIDNFEEPDLQKYLKANYLEVEHRYFGGSLPEPFENANFTYLYTDQAACDLHAVVALLQKHLFPRTNKWVASGTSKGGITATLYAYYSDQYNWNDIDLFVPFCAPFITGTATSCLNDDVGKYILTTCGNGYPAGSTEAIAYQRLCNIPAAISGNQKLREACLRRFHQYNSSFYLTVLNTYDEKLLEKAATAGVVFTFYANLFDKFSYLQYSLWAKYVPDPAKAIAEGATEKDIDAVVEFVFQTEKELEKLVEKEQNSLKAIRRAPYTTDDDIIRARREDKGMPYEIQAYRELGSYVYNYSWVDGTFLTPQFASEVTYITTCDYLYATRYPGQWDGGKVMKAVRDWTKTVSTKPIIFVYSYNDPWTGAAIDNGAANPSRKVWKVVNLIGTHNNAFLKTEFCNPEASKAIKDAINSVLGI